ncbi:GNAT family protein [uncultured Parasphingorhabdus sp.]|uniref:GNAT family N-acetyltransferase n=1 Tax=uncultured Parasphingorhabdus sp. TaxID=2709694 RepID=UPI002AA8D354|nr:GNAT family protein [uncultured Parasphingorhabdus sp.]
MPDTPLIETDQYRLRKLEPGDSAALFETFASEEACRFLARPRFESEAELCAWLTDPEWNGRSWVAIDKSDGALVGRFVAVPAGDEQVSELGYVTVADRQGRGVARACTAALISHLFEREDHRRVFAEIDSRNLASVALAERLGFTREACLREHERTHAGLCDMLVYGLLRREWSGAQQLL